MSVDPSRKFNAFLFDFFNRYFIREITDSNIAEQTYIVLVCHISFCYFCIDYFTPRSFVTQAVVAE